MKRRTKTETPQYEVSIPSRDRLLDTLKEAGSPLNSKEIAARLDMESAGEREAVRKRLKAMVRDGQIIRNRRGSYGLVDKMDLVPGKVVGHADGFGFLIPDAGGEDVYLPAKVMRTLLHGDRAVVRITGRNRRNRPEGAVVEVLERANERVVGRYFQEKQIGFVVPDNKRLHQDIFIPPGQEKQARHGQFVVVKITRQPDKHTQPVGTVTEIIGDHITRGIATDVAIRAYELPHEWPKALQREINSLDPDRVVTPPGRTDFRELPFVTIDGEDARDFDDAVHCSKSGDGWLLYVAIADVSHYVKPGTALDEEALNRGTSVYFPDRVVPMLPEILSNELCSLKPEVDRLALVCEMKVSRNGKVSSSRFCEAVIRSAARLTYTQAAAMMVEKDQTLRDRYKGLVRHLDDLYTLFGKMHGSRRRLGILDFETTESRILFDKDGRIRDIEPVTRNDAHRLIEEFMLAANISAADFLLEQKVPSLFRVHTVPTEEKLKDLREFLKAFGLSLGGGESPDTRDYAKVLEAARDRPHTRLIQTVLLRSMSLAYYGEENLGHFGLAFEAYTHFTSPIRRYPDLLVHRGIKSRILKNHKYPYGPDEMHELGVHCSTTERRAEEASREVVQRLKCEYMKDRIGEDFNATITGVTGFGIFVELDEVYVEGLVHVTALPADYYHHDPVHHLLTGERTGRTFRLANKVRVRLMRVDTDDNKIDFELVSDPRGK